MMRSSSLYHLFSLTTIVASLSLGNFDQDGGPDNGDGGGVQLMTTTTTYIPTTTTTTGNSGEEDPSVEEKDSAPLLLDGQLDDTTLLLDPGWVQATGKEQDQAKKGSCALSSNKKRRSRRGESKGDYCSPTAAPPLSPPSSLHFRPAENSHKVGSEEGPPGGSTTTTTKTGDQQDSSSSSNGQLDLLQLGNDRLQLAPWSSSPTQSACPENRPVAVCAGAEMQPWELGEGWRQIPFSSPNMPSSPPVELLYWPYCRLWTYNVPCKIALNLEIFMCCEHIERNSPKERETIFQLRVWRYMALEYPYNGHSCISAIEPRVRI